MNPQRNTLRQKFRYMLVAAAFFLCLSGGSHRTVTAAPASAKAAERSIKEAGNRLTVPQKLPSAKQKLVREYTAEQIAEKLKYSTGWIVGSRSMGTGWVVDKKHRLMVTNHHVIAGQSHLHVYFPMKKDGDWVFDMTYYRKEIRPIQARVIAADAEADLALLQLEELPAETLALKLAPQSPRQGSQIHSIGGATSGSDGLWTYTDGHVRLVIGKRLLNGRIIHIMEAQMEYNKGNSGGPIVNNKLELVAVVKAYKTTDRRGNRVRNVSLTIDVRQVRAWLQEVQPLAHPTTPQMFLKRGTGLMQLGLYTQAAADFEAASQLDPHNATASARQALAVLLSGDITTAIKLVEQALQIDPQLSEALYVRGRCRQMRNEHLEAVQDFDEAIRLDPQNAAAYNFRGISLLAMGLTQDAYASFVQATQISPHTAVFFGNRAVAARAVGQLMDALKSAIIAFRLNVRQHQYANRAGLILLELNKPKEAITFFTLAAGVHKQVTGKDHWKYLMNLGVAQQLTGDFPAALTSFSKAIVLNPKGARLYYLRGKLYEQIGQTGLSLADYRKAAEIDPKTYSHLKTKGSAAVGLTAGGLLSSSSVAPQEIAGRWVFQTAINGQKAEYVTLLKSDGTYQTTLTLESATGEKQTRSETGTFTISGNRLVLKNKKGQTISRRFELGSRQLRVFVVDIGQWVVYKRLP